MEFDQTILNILGFRVYQIYQDVWDDIYIDYAHIVSNFNNLEI